MRPSLHPALSLGDATVPARVSDSFAVTAPGEVSLSKEGSGLNSREGGCSAPTSGEFWSPEMGLGPFAVLLPNEENSFQTVSLAKGGGELGMDRVSEEVRTGLRRSERVS